MQIPKDLQFIFLLWNLHKKPNIHPVTWRGNNNPSFSFLPWTHTQPPLQIGLADMNKVTENQILYMLHSQRWEITAYKSIKTKKGKAAKLVWESVTSLMTKIFFVCTEIFWLCCTLSVRSYSVLTYFLILIWLHWQCLSFFSYPHALLLLFLLMPFLNLCKVRQWISEQRVSPLLWWLLLLLL